MSRVHRKTKDDELAAEIDAARERADNEWVEKLAARGVVCKGPDWGKPLPDWFFDDDLPEGGEGVLQQLLDDRHSD